MPKIYVIVYDKHEVIINPWIEQSYTCYKSN